MKSEDLVSIIDFLYHGEANIYQENIDSFLAIAEELNLKGLTGGNKDEKETETQQDTSIPLKGKLNTKTESNDYRKIDFKEDTHLKISESNLEPVKVGTVSILNNSSNVLELDTQVMSMMGKCQTILPNGRQANVCNVCGKEGAWQNIKNHIEANHIDGICLPCNLCEKTYRSRKTLSAHKSKHN